MKNFYKIKFNLVSILALIAGLLMQNKIYSQTTLVAGDIIFTGYNSIPAPTENADIISFVLLKDISAGTVINFTDRGYFGNNTWQTVTSTEGTIRWTSGTYLPLGTEVEITALNARARVPGGALTPNGMVIKTEHFNSTYNNASTGMLLANSGDQIIAFQGGTSPTDPGVTFIAGLHFAHCGSNGVNTNDSGWDTSDCFNSPSKSSIPPGLINGFSAFRAIPPSGSAGNYSGVFQCSGAPYASAADIRSAVMNRNNWAFSNIGTGMYQPSGCQFVATCTAPSVTENPANRTICSNSNTTFSVTATGTNPTYQWQVNTGSGYTNISNSGFYSGATTSTLTVSGANASLNGANYRCVITGSCGTATSNAGSLTVTTLSLVTSKTDVLCNGTATGSASVSVTGGSGFYSYSWYPSGGTGSSISNVSVGIHTVTVTDSNGCQNSASVTILQPPALNASTAQANIACSGGNTGAASISVYGGAGGYTYSWSHGPTTQTVTGLSAGNYSVTVTDANNCQIQRNFTITQPAALTATQSQNNVSCNGGSNGTAIAMPSGGAGGYTYSWSHGPTTQAATGLSAGNYSVTITDWNGCQIQKDFTITQPSAFTATQSQTNVSCSGGSNGTATVVASGGAGSYTYSWSPFGGTSATATGLPAGNYTVTIYDWNGCQIQKNFTITQPTAIATTISSQTNVSCNEPNSGEATVAVSGGNPPYIYEWLPSGGTQATATGLAPGTYTVTVTDFNGCQKEQIVVIEGTTAPVLNLDSTTSFCEGSTTQLSATSDAINITGFTGDFSSEGWQLTSNNSNGSITFNPDGTSLQMISSNNNNDASGYHQITKTITANVTVSFNWIYTTNDGAQYDYPRIVINGATSAFSGFGASATQSGTQTVNLNAGDVFGLRIESLDNYAGPATVNITNFTVSNGVSYDYLWTASEGGVINGAATELNLGVDTPGTYTLTATDDEGCQTSKSIVVTEIPNIAPEGEEIQILTQGQTLADLTVTGEDLKWYADEALTSLIPDTTATALDTTYYVTQTINGCESNALAITINCNNPVINLDETVTICENQESIVLIPTSAAYYNTGFTGDFSSGNWQLSAYNSDGSITFNPDGTSLQMISPNNFSGLSGYHQITKTITENVTISFNWSYTTNDGAQFDYPRMVINGAVSAFSGFGDDFNQSGTQTVVLNAGDVFTLSIQSLDNNYGAATVNITNFVVSNGVSYDYLWTASEGGIISGTATELNLVVDTPGTYTLTATNDVGCSTSKSVILSQIPNTPPTGQSHQPLPEGETWTLADLTVTGTNLIWYTDPGLTTSVPDTTQVIEDATYYVTQTDNGCESTALAITISCIELPVSSIDETASFCEGGNVQLSVNTTKNTSGFVGEFASENWQLSSNNSNGSITFNPDGTSLQMISSDNGSSNTGYHQITKTITSNTTVSFNWSYNTQDDPLADYPAYVVNGNVQNFNGYSNTLYNQSGTHTVNLNAGDVFGLRIYSEDNVLGAAITTITNFTFTEVGTYDYLWTASEGGIINGAADVANLLVDTAGTYTVTVTNDYGCSSVHTVIVTENQVDTPQGDATQILNEGQTLADLTVTGTNLTWYSDEDLTIEIPSTTVFVSETTYYVTQTVGNCESPALAITVYDASLTGNCDSFTIWNGTNWSHGTPDITKKMVITGNLTLESNIVACEVLVKSGILNVPTGITLTVDGEIQNMQAANNFVVESSANVIQNQDVANIGDMRVKRNTTIKHLDYTIWSSPVLNQDLQEFSPETLPNRIRVYNGAPAVNNWVVTTGDFEVGKGYMFRAPNVFDDGNYPNAYTWTGNFIGVANNGTIDTEFANIGKFQSLGNPYPSNLDRQAFHDENTNIGALYFWTNTFSVDGNGNYPGNNWKVVNTLGEAVTTDVPSVDPIHYISVGQGFLARVYNDISEANFNNSMRTSQNGIFYRANEVESHKYWLNLSIQNTIVNQTLVSYNSASTNELDYGIDSEQYNYTGSALYSLIGNNNEKYAIQGRALPFNNTDIVPLGFNAAAAGSFAISLANFEGVFTEGQNIYLRDKLTQIEYSLKDGSYSFVSEAGIFNDRFEVIYTTEALNVDNPILENSWLVYKNDNTFQILSKGFQMKDVVVYDMLGRVVYSAKDIHSDTHQFNSVGANQVLIVKVITSDNIELTKKVVN